MERSIESVGSWLDQQTFAWRAVDPERFVEACVDMEVWTYWRAADAIEAMEEFFTADVVAATHRFLDVSVAIGDGSLTEFIFETDEGLTAIHSAIFYAAATAPFNDEGDALDRRAWRVAIMDIIANEEE